MKPAARALAVVGVAAALSFPSGCSSKRARDNRATDAAPSPNATILPSPLTGVPVAAGSFESTSGEPPAGSLSTSGMDGGVRVAGDAGVVIPVALIPGRALGADSYATRETPGLAMSAEWVWLNVPAPPHTPEVSVSGIEAARKLTRHRWDIELSESGRMRVVFDSIAFTLVRSVELRARNDRYGHLLVWPRADEYRVVPLGALRPLLDERRVDVTPMVPAAPKVLPGKGSRFGLQTYRVQLATPLGKLLLEMASASGAGEGGPLLCRALVELIGAQPDGGACIHNAVPVRAEYTWPGDTGLQFEVVSLTKRADLASSSLACPPSTARFSPAGLPPEPTGIFLTREQVAAFRNKPLEGSGPRSDPDAIGAPGEGFTATNHTDGLRFVLIDGVPVAWVPAHGQQYVIGTARGRYVVQWRSFLGAYVGTPRVIEFPAALLVGESPDAGRSEAGATH